MKRLPSPPPSSRAQDRPASSISASIENDIVMTQSAQAASAMTQPVGRRITNVQGFLDCARPTTSRWRTGVPTRRPSSEPAPPSPPRPHRLRPLPRLLRSSICGTDDPGHVLQSAATLSPTSGASMQGQDVELEPACQAESWLDHQRREREGTSQLLAASN